MANKNNIKRFYHSGFIIGLLLSISLYSCEKTPFDYRNKYVGTYTFKISWYEWNIGQGVTAEGQETTSGKIFYAKGKENKNLLRIRYKDNLEIQAKIDNLGFLFATCDVMIGKFDQYNGHLSIQWGSNVCGGGALGGGYGMTLQGEKK